LLTESDRITASLKRSNMFQHVPTLASGSAAASSSTPSDVDIAAQAKQKAKKDPYIAAGEI
jgi:hypothetical protein